MIDVGIVTNDQMDTWHVIMLRAMRTEYMVDWCNEYESDSKFGMGRSTFWFENEQDASMFALRWA